MLYRVVFAPEAEAQLLDLYRYIAIAVSPEIVTRYTDAIVEHCEVLAQFPMRGTPRDDFGKGLRITKYKKRAVIAFSVDDDLVSILGVYYGGQNYESVLDDDG
jgi:toxin ParE1/3/4